MLTNKNSKYLLNKFNNWIKSLNAEKIKTNHSSKLKDDINAEKIKTNHSLKLKDDIGLIKIEEKANQFLIEKIIGAVEKKSYVVSMEEKLKL